MSGMSNNMGLPEPTVDPYDDDYHREDLTTWHELPSPFERLNHLATEYSNHDRLDEAARAGNWERWFVLVGDAVAQLQDRCSNGDRELGELRTSERALRDLNQVTRDEISRLEFLVKELLRGHQHEPGVELSGPQKRVLEEMARRVTDNEWLIEDEAQEPMTGFTCPVTQAGCSIADGERYGCVGTKCGRQDIEVGS